MSVEEMDGAKTITHYANGQKVKEIMQAGFGVAETTYKNGEKTDYIFKATDGTVIDEFHQKTSSSQNIPLNVIQSRRGTSY